MRRGVLNAYNLHKKTMLSKKFENFLLITKFLNKSTRVKTPTKLLARLKRWELGRQASASNQTAVCRRGGGFKKVINLIGFNRHMSRQGLNVKRIPVLKKMSW
jgi:hypothetical protein